MILFFFSSRRRHTRFDCDWSSDVCSSDLDRSPLESLSPRELQVLRLVAEGKTSKDIAVLLDLGLQTIRSYRKTMMKKLGVNNVAGLTQLALAAGITHWNKPDANSLG